MAFRCVRLVVYDQSIKTLPVPNATVKSNLPQASSTLQTDLVISPVYTGRSYNMYMAAHIQSELRSR